MNLYAVQPEPSPLAISDQHRCGVVVMVGEVNVGKSTLLNALVGEKVSIHTPKANTTQRMVRGIYQEQHAQLIIVDTPGLAHYHKDHKTMLGSADVVMWVVTAAAEPPSKPPRWLRQVNKPMVVVVNKIDQVRDKKMLLPLLAAYKQICPQAAFFLVSASLQQGIDTLRQKLCQSLPLGAPMFPQDSYTDQSEKQLCHDLLREQVLYQLQQEIPYEMTIDILAFQDTRHRHHEPHCTITAELIVRKQSHQAIVVGAQGRQIKSIGYKARMQMEKLLGCLVHLYLKVKVQKSGIRLGSW